MKGTVVQVALIAVLAVCGISLQKQLDATRSRTTIERTRAVISERLGLTSIAGVDVHGIVRRPHAEGATRFVVAGFRTSTVDENIRLWTAVAALLANEPDIHIVAYCDDIRCAEAPGKPPRFTMIRYGEASNTQAVLYADGRGDCLVLSPEMEVLRRIAWRAPDRTADDIVLEVRQ